MSLYNDVLFGKYNNLKPFPQQGIEPDLYRKMKKEWHEEELNIRKKLKDDLFSEYNVQDNPYKDKVWELAWEHAHSDGLDEVVIYFEEYVKLIK